MTATDDLRRLLDELVVEWEATADAPDSLTTWATGSDTARWCADELINDRFDLYAYNVDEDVSGLTPAQAIDATLRSASAQNAAHGWMASTSTTAPTAEGTVLGNEDKEDEQ